MYGRYMRHDGNAVMDDNYFPILWTADGARSQWIDFPTWDPAETASPGPADWPPPRRTITEPHKAMMAVVGAWDRREHLSGQSQRVEQAPPAG